MAQIQIGILNSTNFHHFISDKFSIIVKLVLGHPKVSFKRYAAQPKFPLDNILGREQSSVSFCGVIALGRQISSIKKLTSFFWDWFEIGIKSRSQMILEKSTTRLCTIYDCSDIFRRNTNYRNLQVF